MSNSTLTNSSLEEAKKRREAKQQTIQNSEAIQEQANKTVQALTEAQTRSEEALKGLLKDVNAVKNSLTTGISQAVGDLNTLESKLNEWERKLNTIQQNVLTIGQSITEQAKTLHLTSTKLEGNATAFQTATSQAEQRIKGVEATAESLETTMNKLNSEAESTMGKLKPTLLGICGVLVFCVLILIFAGLNQKSALTNAVARTEQTMTNYLTNLSGEMKKTVELANGQLKTINQTMTDFKGREADFDKLNRSIMAMEAAYSEQANRLSKIHLFEAIQHRLTECTYSKSGSNHGICVELLYPISDGGRTITQARLTSTMTPEQSKEMKGR